MKSLFQLKSSVSELKSSNDDITNQQLIQIAPSRDCTTTNFTNGSQYYNIDCAGNKWWIPSRSYFRIRCSLKKGDGTTQLTLSDGIAPNYNLASCLWNSCEARIHGSPVSRVSEYVAQVDAIKNRTEKSRGWMKSVGLSTNFLEGNFGVRQAEVCSDGVVVNEISSVTTGANTPLSSFGWKNNAVLYTTIAGADVDIGRTYIRLRRDEIGSTAVVKGLFNVGDIFYDPNASGGNGREFVISAVFEQQVDQDLQLYVEGIIPPVAEAPLSTADLGEFYFRKPLLIGQPARRVGEFELIYQPSLGLFDYDGALPVSTQLVMNPLSSKEALQLAVVESLDAKTTSDYKFEIKDIFFYCAQVTGPRVDTTSFMLDLDNIRCQQNKISSASFTQKTYDVSPSTRALILAFQDGRAGSDTRISNTKFRMYANTDISVTDDSKDVGLSLNRLYYQYAGTNYPSQSDADPEFKSGVDRTVRMYIDSQLQTGSYFDTGGTERLSEFHTLGSYFYQRVYRDASDKSTRVNVYSQFAGNVTDDARSLLFDISSTVTRIELRNGSIVSVESEDI